MDPCLGSMMELPRTRYNIFVSQWCWTLTVALTNLIQVQAMLNLQYRQDNVWIVVNIICCKHITGPLVA